MLADKSARFERPCPRVLRRRVPRRPTLRHRLGMAALVATLAASTALTANKAAVDEPPKVRICHARTRRATRTCRTSRRSETTATSRAVISTTPGPSTPRTMGRHHPAVRVLGRRRARRRPSRDTTGRRRGRRSGRTGATRRRRQLRPITPDARVRRAPGRRLPGPLRLRQPELGPPSRRRPIENFFSPGDEDRGQPTKFAPGSALETCSRSSRHARDLVAHGKSASPPPSGSPRCRGARSRSSRNSYPTDRRRALRRCKIDGDVGARSRGRQSGHDRHDRGDGRPAHGERDCACRPRRSPTTRSRSSAGPTAEPGTNVARADGADCLGSGRARRVGRMRDHERGEAEADDGGPEARVRRLRR